VSRHVLKRFEGLLMADMSVETELYDLVVSCLPEGKSGSSLRPEMSLRRDLGFDSVQLLLLMFRFEEKFGIEMPSQTLPSGAMTTVGELVAYASTVLQEKR